MFLKHLHHDFPLAMTSNLRINESETHKSFYGLGAVRFSGLISLFLASPCSLGSDQYCTPGIHLASSYLRIVILLDIFKGFKYFYFLNMFLYFCQEVTWTMLLLPTPPLELD
jgi:hypothetical protein